MKDDPARKNEERPVNKATMDQPQEEFIAAEAASADGVDAEKDAEREDPRRHNRPAPEII